MSKPWTLRKYRQISFLLEAGENIDLEKYLSDESYATTINNLLINGKVYNDKKKKYWVANDLDCFAIYARALNITNSDDPIYWEWKLDSGDNVETAMVKKTKWLEVRGSFWTTNLSANVDYQVSFLTRMEKTELLDMKGKVVNLRLIPPNGRNIEDQKALPEIESTEYRQLKVGEFTMTAENVGKMEIVMEASFKRWRAGLVIKGVEIKPR